MSSSVSPSKTGSQTDVASHKQSQKKGIPLRFVTAASLFDGHDAAIAHRESPNGVVLARASSVARRSCRR